LPWAVAKSPNGRYAITRRGRENNVYLNDKTTGKQVDLSEYHIVTVAFSADSRTLFVGTGYGMVKLWNLATLRDMGTIEVEPGSVFFTANASRNRKMTRRTVQVIALMSVSRRQHRPRTLPAAPARGIWVCGLSCCESP
jgi:WD40 repeat protein